MSTHHESPKWIAVATSIACLALAREVSGQTECPLQWVPSPQQGVPGWASAGGSGSAFDSARLTVWMRTNGQAPLLLVQPTANQPIAGTIRNSGTFGWDGNRWRDVFGSTPFVPNAFGTFAGNLVAVGQLWHPQSTFLTRAVLLWNGSNWQLIGSSLASSSGAIVNGTAVAEFNNELIVGGTRLFDSSGQSCMFARWDGTAWRAMPFAQQPQSSVYPWTIQVYHNECYCTDINSNGYQGNVVWKWNGNAWMNFDLNATQLLGPNLIVQDDSLFLAPLQGRINGSVFGLAKLNNGAWQALSASARALCASPHGLVGVSGVFDQFLPIADAQMQRWNGSSWQPFAPIVWTSRAIVFNHPITNATAFGNDIIVTGSFDRAGDVPVLNMARWDGTKWHAMGGGYVPAFPVSSAHASMSVGFGAADTIDGDPVVAGTFGVAAVEGSASHVGRWDGAAWHSFGENVPINRAVRYIAHDGDRLALAGQRWFGTGANDSISAIAEWDGAEWSLLPSPGASNSAGGITYYNGELIHTSDFVGSVRAWNGTSWRTLNLPYPYYVSGSSFVTEFQGALVLKAFVFGSSFQRLPRYDGHTWTDIDPQNVQFVGVNGLVKAGTDLVVFGNFSSIGGISANNIAAWNGVNWRAIGVGRPRAVTFASAFDERLYTLENTGVIETPSAISMWNGAEWSVLDVGQEHTVLAAGADGVIAAGPFVGSSSAPIGTSVYRHWKYFSTPSAPQVVIDQPQVTVCATDATQIVIHANGTAPFDFDWLLNGQPVDLSAFRLRSRIDADERTIRLIIDNPRAADQGLYTCVVSNLCSQTTSEPIALSVIGGGVGECDAIDFNNDCAITPTDIEAFLSVYGEGPCIPAEATCNDIDFNNDTSVFDPIDMDAFFSVYSEGPCF